jgi:hypothetical protein
MFDIHGFFLGFWTMISLLSAALYVFVYCSESVTNWLDNTCDKINEFIDEQYSAIAKRLPLDQQVIMEV